MSTFGYNNNYALLYLIALFVDKASPSHAVAYILQLRSDHVGRKACPTPLQQLSFGGECFSIFEEGGQVSLWHGIRAFTTRTEVILGLNLCTCGKGTKLCKWLQLKKPVLIPDERYGEAPVSWFHHYSGSTLASILKNAKDFKKPPVSVFVVALKRHSPIP